jgi:PhnB protein
MQHVNIPERYQQVMPYLILKDATGFIKFMEDVFEARLDSKHMRDDHTIMHAELQLGHSIIMLADATDEHSVQTASMFLYVDNADNRYNLALGEGATEVTPVADQSYGRSGGIKDPFGNTWWITSVRKM